MSAAAPLKAALAQRPTLGEIALHLIQWLGVFPGSLGAFFRRAGGPLTARPSGLSSPEIFPLPWIMYPKGAGKQAAPVPPNSVLWANLWIGLLNHMYGEQKTGLCSFSPSAAQSRVLASLRRRAAAFVHRCSGVDADGAGINQLLRLHLNDYREHPGVKPLGVRAGLPDSAATVDASAVLRDWDPLLSRQCEDPELLLLPPEARPTVGRRRCVVLDSTYSQLIDQAVASGLHELIPENELPTLNDQPFWNGGFAVPKDAAEDRWISPLEWTNDAIDDQRVGKVSFPYLPQLRSLTLKRGVRARVSKRDARHYYHTLKTGRRWKLWMGQPPVTRGGRRYVPLQRAWPMGFKGSATVAHRITEMVADRAGLPPDLRCLPGLPCPAGPPLWGAIVDDV